MLWKPINMPKHVILACATVPPNTTPTTDTNIFECREKQNSDMMGKHLNDERKSSRQSTTSRLSSETHRWNIIERSKRPISKSRHTGLEDEVVLSDETRVVARNSWRCSGSLKARMIDTWEDSLSKILDEVDSFERLADSHRDLSGGPKAREFERIEIEKVFTKQVRDPTQAGWPSPVVFASDKDVLFRFCVDYWRLNTAFKWESFPKPWIDKFFDSLEETAVFLTLDANDGYWQVEVKERNREKTSYLTLHGIYRFVRIPFGLNIEQCVT